MKAMFRGPFILEIDGFFNHGVVCADTVIVLKIREFFVYS